MIKRLVFSFLFAPTMSFANCGEPLLGFEPKDLTPEFFGCRLGDAEVDTVLQQTAFNLFSGQNIETVVQSLQIQEFTCVQQRCTEEIRKRETSFERWFGTRPTDRRKGERLVSRYNFSLMFKGETSEQIEDIEADFRSEKASVKWHKSAKDSDFEVLSD